MPYVTSDGANIFLDIAGDGPPLLLLHGFGLDHRQWQPQWDGFADVHAAARMDLRAHGRSDASPFGFSYAGMARDVQRVMVQLGMDRLNPGFIVGHSLSADAALQAALAEPRSLRGVVVVSPTVWGHRWSDAWLGTWQAMREAARAGDVPEAFARYRSETIFDRLRDRPELFGAVRAMQASCTGAHLLSDEADTGPSTLERLPGCRVPLLVLTSENDQADFRAAAREIAAAVPAAELHEFAAAGHFPNLETPAPFTAKVLEFLSRHS